MQIIEAKDIDKNYVNEIRQTVESITENKSYTVAIDTTRFTREMETFVNQSEIYHLRFNYGGGIVYVFANTYEDALMFKLWWE